MELSSFDTRVLVRGTYPSLVKYLVKATTDLLGNGGIQAAEIENQFNSVDNKAFLEKFISDANVKSIFIQQNPDTGMVFFFFFVPSVALIRCRLFQENGFYQISWFSIGKENQFL